MTGDGLPIPVLLRQYDSRPPQDGKGGRCRGLLWMTKDGDEPTLGEPIWEWKRGRWSIATDAMGRIVVPEVNLVAFVARERGWSWAWSCVYSQAQVEAVRGYICRSLVRGAA